MDCSARARLAGVFRAAGVDGPGQAKARAALLRAIWNMGRQV